MKKDFYDLKGAEKHPDMFYHRLLDKILIKNVHKLSINANEAMNEFYTI